VAEIETLDDGFKVLLKHWEPADYFESVKSVASVYVLNWGLFAAGLAIVMHIVAYRVGLLSATISNLLYGTILLALGALSQLALFATGSSKKVTKSTALGDLVQRAGIAIGTSPRSKPVEVSEMLVGGSGCSRVSDGRETGKEYVTAKYIINCAGGASDAVARLIGDESFEIKPRVGDYILLNRNQVRIKVVDWFNASCCDSSLHPVGGSLDSHIATLLTGASRQTHDLPMPRSCTWQRSACSDYTLGQSYPWAYSTRHVQSRST
jgi:hypothetical protein